MKQPWQFHASDIPNNRNTYLYMYMSLLLLLLQQQQLLLNALLLKINHELKILNACSKNSASTQMTSPEWICLHHRWEYVRRLDTMQRCHGSYWMYIYIYIYIYIGNKIIALPLWCPTLKTNNQYRRLLALELLAHMLRPLEQSGKAQTQHLDCMNQLTSVCMYIYIYTYIYVYENKYKYIYTYISLSLYIYIYI
jgi:hypothetical protein